MPYGFTCKCKECKERYVGCHMKVMNKKNIDYLAKKQLIIG